ncbi:unnamed protein product [Orchesella dallaii]|uniref:Aldehyde oxidase/xanthine dehydrogenase second molybdopterin binding domain-containing protein n=1 Tax=Orchesella dallaii TaxID=48710 RepID=A0ABP1QS97_9HEXA
MDADDLNDYYVLISTQADTHIPPAKPEQINPDQISFRLEEFKPIDIMKAWNAMKKKQRIVPTQLKTSRITVVQKKENPKSPSDTRPIGNQPIPTKILDKCLLIKLTDYVEENRFFSDFQFGFRKKHSTVAQVVAYTLKIPLDKVRVTPSNNLISPNSGVSGGSVVSELVCSSAQRACEQLLERLEPLRKSLGNPTWEQLIAAANAREVLLTSQFQHMQGDVKSYDIWGVTVTEVEIDVLTGDFKIVRVDLIEDAGESLSPLVDIGQIEGSFVMGLSWWLTEELIYDQKSGELLTDRTTNYKPMLASDIPEDFRVTILRNAPNPFGALSSKATGEPPLNMSCSVIFALRNAIDSARREIENTSWYQMDGPVTREVVRKLCLVAPEEFTI